MENTETQKYETSEHVVAFIDILGASKMIEEDESKSLNDIHQIYKAVLKLINREEIAGFFKLKIFSDNIVIAVPTFSATNKKVNFYASWFHALLFCLGIQLQFIMKGYLVRGGITCGSFFLDDVMVFGKALLKSYELENKNAIYPRIIVDPNFIPKLTNWTEYNPFSFLNKDKDSLYYVNYMYNAFGYDKQSLLKIIGELIEEADVKIKEYRNNISITQKWEWHKQYLIGTQKDMEGKNEKQ